MKMFSGPQTRGPLRDVRNAPPSELAETGSRRYNSACRNRRPQRTVATGLTSPCEEQSSRGKQRCCLTF
jgi:hypothetical protein